MPINIDIENIPDDVNVSTITITCKLPTIFNVENIYKYIQLEQGNIIFIKYGNMMVRSIKKTKEIKHKKVKKYFYNQTTMQIENDGKYISLKVFNNGSFQLTGCTSLIGTRNTLDKVFKELKRSMAVYDTIQNKIIDKPFADNIDMLNIEHIYDFKINMINCNFNIGFEINRTKLCSVLTEDNISHNFDPIKHAGVITRYQHNDKQVSIFIFESGSIVITGAETCEQVKLSYNYINKYLLTKYNYIVKNDKVIKKIIFQNSKKNNISIKD